VLRCGVDLRRSARKVSAMRASSVLRKRSNPGTVTPGRWNSVAGIYMVITRRRPAGVRRRAAV